MKAIAIDRFGGVDELKLQILPIPEPESGEAVFYCMLLKTNFYEVGNT